MITEITTQPVNATVIALEDFTLHCSASVDNVTYRWHRVDCHLPSRSRGNHSDTLTIPRVTPRDEGMYYCTARKSNIHIESGIAVMTVDGKELL